MRLFPCAVALVVARAHPFFEQLQAALGLLVVLGAVIRSEQLVARDFTLAEAARITWRA